jgi:integrase
MAGSVYKRCPCGTTGTRGKPACKKAHGTWWFRADGLRNPETGRRRQPGQGGFRTKAEAEGALAEFVGVRSAGRLRDDRGMTVSQWFDRWLAEGSWELLTVDTYRTHIESMWRKRIGHIRRRDLRKHHVEETLREEAVDRSGRPRMPRTPRSYRATLRACMTVAVDAGYIADNPAAGNFKALPSARKVGLNMWQRDELRLFLAVSSDKRDAQLWRVAGFTGLRRAELCGLQNVDLTGKHPGRTIRQTVPGAGRPALLHHLRRREPRLLRQAQPQVRCRRTVGAVGARSRRCSEDRCVTVADLRAWTHDSAERRGA